MDSKNNDKQAGSNGQNKIADHNPSKAMDSKQEVENSNDPKIEQDFPGYPHYPAKEDIMDKRTDSHRVDADVENLPNSNNKSGVSQRFTTDQTQDNANAPHAPEPPAEDDFRDINPRTENTSDGLETLGSTNAEIGIPQNVDNEDLDDKRVPGTDLEDDLDMRTGTDADVTLEERISLENVFMPTTDDNNLRRAALDNEDFDGEPLNEEGFGEVLSGADLDVPGAVDETRTTALGQGDEENKYYSLGSDRHESGDEEDPYSGPNRDNS